MRAPRSSGTRRSPKGEGNTRRGDGTGTKLPGSRRGVMTGRAPESQCRRRSVVRGVQDRPRGAHRGFRGRIFATPAAGSPIFCGRAGTLDARRKVASCPDWTVREVTAHLVGVTADALAGNLADAGTDPWTAAQVDKRRPLARTDPDRVGRDRAAAGEGHRRERAPRRTSSCSNRDPRARHRATRSTLPGAQDADSTHIALDFVIESGPTTSPSTGSSPSGSTPVRPRSWPARASRSPRSPCPRSRRSERFRPSVIAQLTAYDWDADPTLWLPCFTYGPFTPPAYDIVE